MSMSDIAHYLPSRITSGLLRQEISVTYKSLRNVYLGVLGDNQEQNLQSNDNHQRGLRAGRAHPGTVRAANIPRDLRNPTLPWLQECWLHSPSDTSWAQIRNQKFLSLLEAQKNPAGLYLYSKQLWVMFPMIPGFHPAKQKVLEISQECSPMAPHHQTPPHFHQEILNSPTSQCFH